MKRERYGEYEQVNGATANRLMDEVDELELILADVLKKLELIREAALDLVDGMQWWDLHEFTGLPEERCKDILHLLSKEMNDE